ncbi:hypothetical protein evm_012648 [Chilo suppressalis]|nr:hypothetical protein evm_012648 [Chilo suppressalis]
MYFIITVHSSPPAEWAVLTALRGDHLRHLYQTKRSAVHQGGDTASRVRHRRGFVRSRVVVQRCSRRVMCVRNSSAGLIMIPPRPSHALQISCHRQAESSRLCGE